MKGYIRGYNFVIQNFLSFKIYNFGAWHWNAIISMNIVYRLRAQSLSCIETNVAQCRYHTIKNREWGRLQESRRKHNDF